jgi:small-conductance mechanosensitive channel
VLALIVVAISSWLLSSATVAEESSVGSSAPVTVVVKPGQTSDELARLVMDLRKKGLSVVLQLGETQQAPAQQVGPTPVPSDASPGTSVSDYPDIFANALVRSVKRIAAIPGLIGDVASRVRSGDFPAISALALWAAAAIVLALTAGIASWLLLTLLLGRFKRRTTTTFTDRLARAALRGMADLIGVFAFWGIGQAAADALFAESPTGLWAVSGILRTVAIFGLYWSFARLLVEPVAAGERLLPIGHPDRNKRLFLMYALLGGFVIWTTGVLSAVATSPASIDGWLYFWATLVNAYKVWWLWTIRQDVSELILRSGDAGAEPRFLARFFAVAIPVIGILLPVALWVLITVGSFSAQRELFGNAAAATQALFFLVPIGVAGTAALTHALFSHHSPPTHPYAEATRDVTTTLVGGAVAVAGLLVLLVVWHFALGAYPRIAEALRAIATAGVVLLIGWILLRYLKAFFDAHAPKPPRALPGEDDVLEEVPQSRIATALPLIRNLAIGAVSAVFLLIALSKLGVDITPLLAGAGIVGLALSFGSQALVRDIVSGIFFMADDAFRVGEYIDTGRLKGNVERITLRALQLRHQNGQVHTIPYGQLASITNFSRDWATMKFTIRVDRSANIETVRKTIKKVGEEMLTDPEVGHDFLLPVKMQGITDITENALVVRIKFTAKPLRPTYVQRLALRRIYAALTTAGVQFASHAVMVLGSGGDPRAAAAADGPAVGMFRALAKAATLNAEGEG